MVGTNVPPLQFSTNGFFAPSAAAILAGAQADINTAFGGGLNPGLTTPQGQLATSETAVIQNCYDLFVNLTQQMDPAYATGRFQDGIARIYFLNRNGAQPTVLQITCSGGNGVIIAIGAAIVDSDNNYYLCINGGTIPGTGSVLLAFAAQIPGPIPVPETVTIVSTTPGWDSAAVASGVVGSNTESRQAFEIRREDSVAANSLGAIGSIIGAVAKVQGVSDYYGNANPTSSPVTVNGATIPAYGIFISVAGSATQKAIGTAILSKKSPGCAMGGNTTVNVFDNNPLYTAPIEYSITYETPLALQIVFSVDIVSSNGVPSNVAALVQGAITQAFNGLFTNPLNNVTTPRARIGSLILASDYMAAVQNLGPWARVRALLIGSSNDSDAASFTGVIAGTALTVSGVTGTIAIGQTLLDAAGNIPPGTTIVSGSGTTWVISNSLTVSSEAMTSVTPLQDAVQVLATQSPTLASANIAVTVA